MITLKVFFHEYDPNDTDGTAVLYENLITNSVKLVINNHVLLSEIECLIDKAVNILKLRYDEVNVDINWKTANKVEESDK